MRKSGAGAGVGIVVGSAVQEEGMEVGRIREGEGGGRERGREGGREEGR